MTLKTTTSAAVVIKLNFAQVDGKTETPEWLEIIPAGIFTGRDGRRFKNINPNQAINNMIERDVDIPLDIEHATEVRAPQGQSAPAQSWIDAKPENFEIRDGAVWGRVNWNSAGLNLIQQDEYRYYSPAFYVDPNNQVDIIGVKSIGFTNTPNLSLTALNNEENPDMDLSQLAALLGLNSEASLDVIIGAVNTLKNEKQVALNSAKTPDATKFIPKETYDLALNRAETAEQKLADDATEQKTVAVNAAVDAAVTAGKIAPANKDFYVTSCNAEGGLEAFNKFVETAPVIAPTGSTVDASKPPAGGTVSLNAEERVVATQLGLTDEEFIESKGDQS